MRKQKEDSSDKIVIYKTTSFVIVNYSIYYSRGYRHPYTIEVNAVGADDAEEKFKISKDFDTRKELDEFWDKLMDKSYE